MRLQNVQAEFLLGRGNLIFFTASPCPLCHGLEGARRKMCCSWVSRELFAILRFICPTSVLVDGLKCLCFVKASLCQGVQSTPADWRLGVILMHPPLTVGFAHSRHEWHPWKKKPPEFLEVLLQSPPRQAE